MTAKLDTHRLRAGMVGMGMIFDETYRPLLENLHAHGLFDLAFGHVHVPLVATASRTGRRARAYKQDASGRIADFACFAEPDSVGQLLEAGADFVCVATPDDRHFAAAKAVLEAGKHLLVEKPSVLRLQELDELARIAREKHILAKVVYHKLLDPDHKKLRTLVHDGVLRHVNSGYCSLLEPKQISGAQFAEWITGRNPGTYVAVHYIKLIDFTFPGRLKAITAAGQRGIVGPPDGNTWDSVQLRMIYEYPDPPTSRERQRAGVPGAQRAEVPGATAGLSSSADVTAPRQAAFDIHTSWVTPDNFPGYVEQEVQFRFDNGVWNGHSRKRGVELTVEGKTPVELKTTLNNHYNGTFVEPWGERSQRGYGLEVLERFIAEVATVEFGGPAEERQDRLEHIAALSYNDISADRQTVAAVQAMEAILDRAAKGQPDAVVYVNHSRGGLVLFAPGESEPEILYEPLV